MRLQAVQSQEARVHSGHAGAPLPKRCTSMLPLNACALHAQHHTCPDRSRHHHTADYGIRHLRASTCGEGQLGERCLVGQHESAATLFRGVLMTAHLLLLDTRVCPHRSISAACNRQPLYHESINGRSRRKSGHPREYRSHQYLSCLSPFGCYFFRRYLMRKV